MVVMNDTTVRTERNVDTSLFKILVSFLCKFYYSGSLATADTLCFTGYADGSSADTDLYEVCTSVSKESECFAVNDVSCTDLYCITMFVSYKLKYSSLPF